MDASVSLSDLTGITATGNGAGAKNVIENRGGTVNVSRTWAGASIPYVVINDTSINSGTTLTIGPGATIKFADSLQLSVSGTLTAIGTASQPITFTTNRTTPAAGSWSRMLFNAGASASRLEYATVSYGGGFASGAVVVIGSSPRFDHVTFSNSSSAGLFAQSAAGPVVTNSQFSSNASGLQLSSATADARLCYWSSDSGPSGSGPGSGQSVHSSALFEPWLTAAPSSPQFLTTASVTDATFNPTIATARFAFTTALTGSWTATITDSGGVAVRTITGSGAAGTADWDGKNDSGTVMADGSYRILVQSVGSLGEQSSTARARLQVDGTKQFTISNRSFLPVEISPNGDAVQDSVTVQATASYENVTWTTTIRNAGGSAVRTLTAAGTTLNTSWDGRDTGGAVVVDGSYTAETVATLSPTVSSSYTDSVVVDTVIPVAAITQPTESQSLSNIHQNGATEVVVQGSATDARIQSWTLEFMGPGQAWATIASGTASAVDQTLHTWTTATGPNGAWILRLTALDRAGNRATVQRSVTVGNFTMSQEAKWQANPGTGGTMTYTSNVPFGLSQTVVIKDAGGNVVRTLFSGTRTAGTHTNVWDGNNASGGALPDGAYFFSSSLSVGASTMSWDQSNQYRGGEVACPFSVSSFDPFNNQPLRVTYNCSQTGLARLLLKPTKAYNGRCDEAGVYCVFANDYQATGSRWFDWIGVDEADNLRTDLINALVITSQAEFALNGVVMYGRAPSISNVVVTPPVYSPWAGNQTVSFSVSTFQSLPYSVDVTFKNMASHSVLRTISLTNVTPGANTVTWDGRADDGSWVASGQYIVKVTVQDGIGNVVKNAILTRIDY